MILFYSSHSFGFFSATQIDVQCADPRGHASDLIGTFLGHLFRAPLIISLYVLT